jgi:DHA2 family multidrug resistance protein
MMRQLGGSIGIALITTFVDRRSVFHQTALSVNLNGYNNAFLQRFNGMVHQFIEKGFGLARAQQMAYTALRGAMQKQSMLMSYTDVFWMVGIFFLCIIPLIVFQKMKHQRSLTT